MTIGAIIWMIILLGFHFVFFGWTIKNAMQEVKVCVDDDEK